MPQQGHSYTGDESYRDMSSAFSSQANTLDRSSDFQGDTIPSGRATLHKHQGTDADSVKGKKRFSRRHSKNGLAAVF
jgi:3-phosphoinositide dependent protein kinase-1